MIELVQVTKTYNSGRLRALADVSMVLKDGQITALVGENGAGKTTAIRIGVGVSFPDSGEVRIDGRSLWEEKRASSKRIAWVGDKLAYDPSRNLMEEIRYFARLRGMGREESRSIGLKQLELYGLHEKGSAKVGALSKGMLKRFALAVATLGSPPNLLLDEPFDGLDPVGQSFLEGILVGFKRAGAAVVLATHDLRTVERLADQVMVLQHGRLTREVRPREVHKPGNGSPKVRITVGTGDEDTIRSLAELGKVELRGDEVILEVDLPRESEALRELLNRGLEIRSLEKVEPSLRDALFPETAGNS
jgi:ABC-type multidrug transport system ATPase subunit